MAVIFCYNGGKIVHKHSVKEETEAWGYDGDIIYVREKDNKDMRLFEWRGDYLILPDEGEA